MVAMAIHRMRLRYHLPGADHDDQEELRRRLDGVVGRALGSTLDAALERAGVPSSEEICIRSLAVPVRLRLDSGDPDLAAEWSMAVSSSLVATIERGGDDVVRYPSSTHVVLDLAKGVATGDTSRAWAWQQLGHWDDTATGLEQVEMVVQALLRTPKSVVPVLSELARSGALAVVGRLLSPSQWRRLALAALAAAKAPIDSTALAGPLPHHAIGSDMSLLAERVVRRSSLAGVLSGLAQTANAALEPGLAEALAVLVAVEADPGTVRSRHSGMRFRVAIEQVLLSSSAGEVDGAALGLQPEPQGERAPLPGFGPERPDRAAEVPEATARPPAGPPETVARESAAITSRARSDRDGRSPDRARLAESRATTAGNVLPPPTDGRATPTRPAAPGDLVVADAMGIAHGLGFHRSSGSTQYGGLLFLLHLCLRIDLVDRLDDALADRPVRWVMHRLATGLLRLADDDPAALAFAGLAPDAVPPSATEPPASTAERDALTVLAARVVSALVELLERTGEPATSLLRSVCRRTAVIVADPGWIDVQLRLDERTVEVRRAGLDLDPGYVPWLGVAVRFVYD